MGIQEFIAKVCVQTAVYWTAGAKDGFGNNVWTTGVEILVRWDDVTEIIRNKYGKEVTSFSQVLIQQDISMDGYLYLGSLSDLTASQKVNPKLVPLAYPIQKFEKSPEFASTDKFVRVAYL